VRVITDVLSLDISKRGGDLERADLLKYAQVKNHPELPVRLFSPQDPRYVAQSGLRAADKRPEPNHLALYRADADEYRLKPGESKLVVPLTWSEDGITVTKTYTFYPGTCAVKQKTTTFPVVSTDQNGTGGYKVLKPAEYYQGVTASLQSAGFCAETDSVSVSVRNGIDFSEDYDILLGTGHVRRGQGSYRQTCTPPSFPLDASQVISYIRVAFYSIRCPEGVEVPRNAEDKLPVGCTGFVTATPKTKDNLDVKQGLIGTQIDWTFEQEGEHVRLNEFGDDVPFNKVLTAVNLGHWTLCATVKAFRGCQFGEVTPGAQ